jgi:hypothetical protein
LHRAFSALSGKSGALALLLSGFQRFIRQMLEPGFFIVALSALYQANVKARFFLLSRFQRFMGQM